MWLNYVSDSCRFCLFSASLSRFLHFVFAYLYFKSPFTVHTGSGAATRCSARQRRTVRCLVCCKPSWLFIIRTLLSIGEQNIVMSVSLSDMIMVDPWVGLNLSNTQICLLNRRTAVTAPQIHSNGWLWHLIEFYCLLTYWLTLHFNTLYTTFCGSYSVTNYIFTFRFNCQFWLLGLTDDRSTASWLFGVFLRRPNV